MNPVDNYLLVSWSLVTKSWILRGAFAILVLISLGFSLIGHHQFAVFTTMTFAFGIGISVFNYRNWQAGSLIPRFNFVYANAAIGCVIAAWLVLLSLMMSTINLNALMIGGTLFAVTLPLAFVYRPYWMFLLMVTLFVIAIIVVATRSITSDQIESAYKDLVYRMPSRIAYLTGIFLMMAGGFMLVQFWKVATDRRDRESVRSRRQDIDELTGTVNLTSLANMKRPFCGPSWRLAIPAVFSSGSFWVMMVIIATAFYGSLFFGRGHEAITYMVMFVVYAACITAPTVALALMKIPQKFEQLWAVGATRSRTATALKLISVVLFASFVTFIACALAILIQVPMKTILFLPLALMTIVSISIGGLFLWAAIRTFRIWSRFQDTFAILFIVSTIILAAMLLVLGPHEDLLVRDLALIATPANLLEAIVGMFLVYGFCLLDGSSSLGRMRRLME